MIKLVLDGDIIHLWCEYADKDKCHTIGGGRWNSNQNCWDFYATSLPIIADVFKGRKVNAGRDVFDLLESLRYRDELLEAIKAKKVDLDPHPFLMYHQRQVRAISKYFHNFAYFLDTGTGKTIASLALIQDTGAKFLVICPKTIIKSAWVEDRDGFFNTMNLLPLSRNMKKEDYENLMHMWGVNIAVHTKDKLKTQLSEHAQIFVTNPEAFKSDLKDIKELGIQGLIVDESTTIKNPQSQITKMVTAFADTLEYKYILSGKPAPQSQMDYFSQMRVVDASLFGSSFFGFRNKYFEPTGYMGYDWRLKPGAEEAIAERLSKRSIFIKKEDCLDLPPITYERRDIELTPSMYKYYLAMEKAQLAELQSGDMVLAPNAMAAKMKNRQIASGFILYSNEENERAVEHLHDSKFNELINVLDEIGDKPVIIWAQFKYEIRTIAERLAKEGKSVVTAYSETKDVDDAVYRFKHGQAQYMVAHPATLKFGVTFTGCSYAVYFSKSYNYEEYYQSHDRIYRNGQTMPCTFIDLVVTDTVDEDINKIVKSKGSASLIIENMVRRCSL